MNILFGIGIILWIPLGIGIVQAIRIEMKNVPTIEGKDWLGDKPLTIFAISVIGAFFFVCGLL